MALVTKIIEHPHALQRLLNGRDGGIARDLARRSIRVQNQMKQNASGRPGPNIDTGRLKGSITWEIREDADGLEARIGTNVEYALPLETGLRNGNTYPFMARALSAARG